MHMKEVTLHWARRV